MRNPPSCIAVATLGQIVGSDYWKSISAFAEIAAQYSKYSSIFPHFIAYKIHYALITLRYGWDVYLGGVTFLGGHKDGGYIERYNKGMLNDEEFITFLKTSTTTLASDDLMKNGWNVMCTMSKEKKEYIGDNIIHSLQQNPQLCLIIPSATNNMQYSHIERQLKNTSFADDYEALVRDGRIRFSLSFNQGVTSLLALTNTALKNIREGLEADAAAQERITHLVSLHRGIPTGCLESIGGSIVARQVAQDVKFSWTRSLANHFSFEELQSGQAPAR